MTGRYRPRFQPSILYPPQGIFGSGLINRFMVGIFRKIFALIAQAKEIPKTAAKRNLKNKGIFKSKSRYCVQTTKPSWMIKMPKPLRANEDQAGVGLLKNLLKIAIKKST